MTDIIYTARRTAECIAEKVAAARISPGVVELRCEHCNEQVLGLKPMFEQAIRNAALACSPLRVLCRQCTELLEGLPLELQDAAARAGNGGAIIATMKPPRGGDA